MRNIFYCIQQQSSPKFRSQLQRYFMFRNRNTISTLLLHGHFRRFKNFPTLKNISKPNRQKKPF